MKKQIEETYARAELINPGITERAENKQLRFIKEVKEAVCGDHITRRKSW